MSKTEVLKKELAPLIAYLSDESQQHFAQLVELAEYGERLRQAVQTVPDVEAAGGAGCKQNLQSGTRRGVGEARLDPRGGGKPGVREGDRDPLASSVDRTAEGAEKNEKGR